MGRLLKKNEKLKYVHKLYDMEKTERPHVMIAGNSTVNKDQQSANQK